MDLFGFLSSHFGYVDCGRPGIRKLQKMKCFDSTWIEGWGAAIPGEKFYGTIKHSDYSRSEILAVPSRNALYVEMTNSGLVEKIRAAGFPRLLHIYDGIEQLRRDFRARPVENVGKVEALFGRAGVATELALAFKCNVDMRTTLEVEAVINLCTEYRVPISEQFALLAVFGNVSDDNCPLWLAYIKHLQTVQNVPVPALYPQKAACLQQYEAINKLIRDRNVQLALNENAVGLCRQL